MSFFFFFLHDHHTQHFWSLLFHLSIINYCFLLGNLAGQVVRIINISAYLTGLLWLWREYKKLYKLNDEENSGGGGGGWPKIGTFLIKHRIVYSFSINPQKNVKIEAMVHFIKYFLSYICIHGLSISSLS